MTKNVTGPLHGVRILDLSRILAGPFCTALLADLGAEVVKIEQPGGEDSRHIGPFVGDHSIYFALCNRNKKSIALDLKTAADNALLKRLVESADVFVENFRPGVAARLGLDFATLREINPELIYLSISGFGQHGPLAGKPAYDIIVQAMCGLMSITGTPEGGPTRVGESMGDLISGLYGAWAVSTALFARREGKGGMYIDLAMFDSLFSLQVTALAQYFAGGTAPGRVGNRHPVSAPFDSFVANDGVVVIAATGDAMFERLSGAMRQPELAADPRFSSADARSANEPALKRLIEGWTRTLAVDEIVGLCNGVGVPAGPVWDVARAVRSEQETGRGLIQEVAHPALGMMRYLRQPVRFGDFIPTIAPEPALGADRDEVVEAWLGSGRAEKPA